MNSRASSEQSSPQATETEQADSDNVSSGASAFAAALAAEVGDEDKDKGAEEEEGAQGGEGGESKKKPKPEDLNAVAERLGVPVAELYAVKIPASGGREPMTIGQIKDKFAEWDSLESDRVAFDEGKVKAEQDLELARAEFRELLAVIPKEALNKENLGRVAQRLAERAQAQTAKILETIPAWRDDAVRTAGMEAITKMLAGYGFAVHEVKALKDHRLVKLLVDAERREQQVRAALAKVKKVPARKTPPQQLQTRGAPRSEQQQQKPTGKPVSARDRFTAALANER